MHISRRNLICSAVANTILLPAASYAATEDVGSFRSDVAPTGALPWTTAPTIADRPLGFTVIGDNTAFARPGVFDQAMVQVSWLRPDFVMSVGDLIEGYHDDRATIARQWDDAERSIAKLQCPFCFCVGNHDINNDATFEAWRQRRGPTYYSFTYKNALFVVLNTEDPPISIDAKAVAPYYSMVELMKVDPEKAMKDMNAFIALPELASARETSNVVHISDRQLAWVRDTLARNPNPQWTFVVMHKPGWKLQSKEFVEIQAMLSGRPHTVIAGHTHYFTHEVFEGHDYINMATCGGIRSRPGPGNIDHVVNVTLTQNGPLYANMRLTGLMNVAGETGQTLAY
jgi:UDP-2,3-diacylglucosamine pyrophosphatase LpxH